MPNYQNSIIYKLCHQDDLENNNIYVGSTTNFRNRKYKHKSNCNIEKNKKYNSSVYKFIRDNGGWQEWQMLPIEVFPCNDKKELEIRERYHIELLKSKLNQIIPTRTDKEWRVDNKEVIKEKAKQYREANNEIILEKAKEYYKSNKQQIDEKHKKYYEDNKNCLLEKAKEKIICNHCGSEINKNNLSRHQKTKKCIETI